MNTANYLETAQVRRVAVAFGKQGPLSGFDVDQAKVEELRKGIDRTDEVSETDLAATQIRYIWEPADLTAADFIIVAMPPPIHSDLPGASNGLGSWDFNPVRDDHGGSLGVATVRHQ